MSFSLKSVGDFFKGVGESIVHALGYASTHGLTDAVLKAAELVVKDAALKFIDDNAAKREYAVRELQKTGLGESISRLAVELAVQAVKGELAKLGSK